MKCHTQHHHTVACLLTLLVCYTYNNKVFAFLRIQFVHSIRYKCVCECVCVYNVRVWEFKVCLLLLRGGVVASSFSLICDRTRFIVLFRQFDFGCGYDARCLSIHEYMYVSVWECVWFASLHLWKRQRRWANRNSQSLQHSCLNISIGTIKTVRMRLSSCLLQHLTRYKNEKITLLYTHARTHEHTHNNQQK